MLFVSLGLSHRARKGWGEGSVLTLQASDKRGRVATRARMATLTSPTWNGLWSLSRPAKKENTQETTLLAAGGSGGGGEGETLLLLLTASS